MSHDLIIVANTDGHRLNYVRLLAEHSLRMGNVVTVAFGKSARSKQNLDLHLSDLIQHISIVEAPSFSPTGIAQLAKEIGADRVIDPDGDQLAAAILRNGRWPSRRPITLLIMRPEAQKSPFPGARRMLTYGKALSRFLLSLMRAVRVVKLVDSLERHPAKNEVPDPIGFSASPATTQFFKSEHNLDSNRFWFAVVGAIDARKNIDLVAAGIAPLGSHAGLLVAGRVSSEARPSLEIAASTLTATGAKFVTIDRLLSETEIDSAIAAADCVVLAHSNEGASGIMGKAVAAGTRIIASGAQSLRHASSLAPSHAEWVPLTVHGLQSAALRATDRPQPPTMPQRQNFFAGRLLS